jgi:hypothetical protein
MEPSEPSRGRWLGRLSPPASSLLYDDTGTLLALWFDESGASGMLEDFADTLTSAGRALEVHAGTNLLCDGLTLKEGWKSHFSMSQMKETVTPEHQGAVGLKVEARNQRSWR